MALDCLNDSLLSYCFLITFMHSVALAFVLMWVGIWIESLLRIALKLCVLVLNYSHIPSKRNFIFARTFRACFSIVLCIFCRIVSRCFRQSIFYNITNQQLRFSEIHLVNDDTDENQSDSWIPNRKQICIEYFQFMQYNLNSWIGKHILATGCATENECIGGRFNRNRCSSLRAGFENVYQTWMCM